MASLTDIVRIKCGTIFILSDNKFSLICKYCGDEFFTLNEFGIHLNKHFPKEPTKIKTEICETNDEWIPPDAHNNYVDNLQNDDGLQSSAATYKLPDALDQQFNVEHLIEEALPHIIGEVQSNIGNENFITLDSNEKEIEHPRTRSTSQAKNLIKIIEESDQLAIELNNENQTVSETSPFSYDPKIESQQSHAPTTVVVSNPPKARKKGFQCSYCPKIYRQRRDHINHENSHTGKRPYQCEICSKTFTGALNLHQHKRIHLNNLPHKCLVCNEQFMTPFLLDVHTRKLHLPDTDPKRYFQCKDCDVKCKSYTQLAYHRQNTHWEVNPTAYICDYCERQFPTRRKITEHMIRHTHFKIYKCQFCDKAYPYRNSKSKHERTQHMDIPF